MHSKNAYTIDPSMKQAVNQSVNRDLKKVNELMNV